MSCSRPSTALASCFRRSLSTKPDVLDALTVRRRSLAGFFLHNHQRAVPRVLSTRRLLDLHAQLAKPHLSSLVVLTAMSGFALSPLPTTVPVLLSTAFGTFLCAASANTLNQLQEVPFDGQMPRTRMRPLVRKAVTPAHAAGFALATGVGGTAVLLAFVNSTTAVLGAANIVLYAGLYTWLKRKSVVNTWVGAVVGGLPPLMGWTACGGHIFPYSISTFDSTMIDSPIAPLALFLLLFSWQFPHFNSLSHPLRGSYAQAGYRMLCVLSPERNALVSLRHALLLIPVCSVLVPLSGLTTWTFAFTALVPNSVFSLAAWRFWRRGGEKEARVVFRHSLWYLPAILGLMMVHKQGVSWLEWMGVRDENAGGNVSTIAK
jgi:protoheme IX farnesyltransferase